MKRISILIVFLSLTLLYACPLSESNENEEEVVVDEKSYGENEYENGEEKNDQKHIENPGDIAGSLIF